MVHYPNQILRHGPLVRSWTMRHEGKLNFFKQAARLGNFKNISLTLSNRHQRWLAYHLQTNGLFSQEMKVGPIVVSTQLSDETIEVKRQISQYNGDSTITKYKWLKVNSLKYSSNNCFIVMDVNNCEPQFGRVLEIAQLSSSSHFYFYVSMYET